MSLIHSKFFSKIVIGLVALTIISYYHRFPTGDDAWFAEQAYWLMHDGIVRSEFFRGLLGWENQLFVSHKLFLLVGAMLMKLFGTSLYVSKLSGLLFFALFIYLLFRYTRQRNLSNFGLMLFLVFSNTLFIKMSFENRPEMMLISLGFASYLLIQSERKVLISLAGILAGMAVLTHLNGIIYLIAGFFMLFLNKKLINSVIFLASGILISSFYFYDVLKADAFSTWLYQFRHDPATINSFDLLSKIKVLFEFPTIFFKSPEQISTSVMLLILLVIHRKRLNELPRNLIIYSLSLLFSFWLITKRATGIYQVLFLPMMFVMIGELFQMKISSLKTIKTLNFGLILYLIVGLIGGLQLIYKIHKSTYLPTKYQEISANISDKNNGLVPLKFFFNEYPKHTHLKCFDDFYLQQKLRNNSEPNTQNFEEWLNKNQPNFIVFDYEDDAFDFYPKAGSAIKGFQLKYFDKRFSIYEKMITH